MGAFEYEAINADGRTRRGVAQGDTARQVRQRLREQGLVPLQVSAVERSNEGREFSTWGRFGRERALLLRQLTTLLKAGLPLEEALSALVEQAERPGVRRRLAAIRSHVVEGQSLSAAMAGQGGLFPAMFTAAIAAGERAGRLEAVLERLSRYAEQRETMSRNLGMAMAYPLLLASIALVVVWGLLSYVVPRVIEVFDNVGQDLPWMTRSLMWLADFMRDWGIWLLPAGVLLVAVCLLVLRRPAPRAHLDALVLRLPLFGRLVRSQQTARFTRTLAILAASAVPLVEALRVAAGVVGNRRVRQDLQRAAARVREGGALSQALADAHWLPPMARRLIASGERSGELADMLEHAADVQERELEVTLGVIVAVLQPALILLVGLVVLYIVLAIMLPILDMSQLVQ